MPVNVHLPDGRISGGMWGHGTIGGFIRIIGIIPIRFFKGFELLDEVPAVICCKGGKLFRTVLIRMFMCGKVTQENERQLSTIPHNQEQCQEVT